MEKETVYKLDELDMERASAGLGQLAFIGNGQTAILEVVFNQDNQVTLVS
jgi:hypothetical protein